MIQLCLILDNIRSASNVGAILRTADAVGAQRVIVCGITPYPRLKNDDRDPVVAGRNSREIAKTALGAEHTVTIEHIATTEAAIERCRAEGRTIFGLEQSLQSQNIFQLASAPARAALVVCNEVDGMNQAIQQACDTIIEIPQRGAKESLNVSVATGIALYQLTYGLPKAS